MRRALVFSLLSVLAFGQAQSGAGRYYGFQAPYFTGTYGTESCNSGSGTTPYTCNFSSSIPAGSAIVGVVMIFNSGNVLTSVCDGTTGTGNCTGSDTFTLEASYANGTTFQSYTYYTCSTAASVSSITFSWTGGSGLYPAVGSYFGIAPSGCLDGYGKNQGTTGTSFSSGAITPTGGHDLLIGLQTNPSTCGTVSAGTDGQGNSMTQNVTTSSISNLQSFQETSSQSYTAAASGTASCHWNMEVIALKTATNTLGQLSSWSNGNGRNYASAGSGNGLFYGTQFAVAGLQDYNAGTNGGTPTATTLFNSIIGTLVTNSASISVAGMDTSYKYSNFNAPVSTPAAEVISSKGYTGNSGLGVTGTTSTTGTNIGEVSYDLTGTGTSTSYGVSLYWTCPGNPGQDCGALAGLESQSANNYAVPHILQNGSAPGNSMFQEGYSGAGGTHEYYAVQNSTLYRLNEQLNTSGNNYMKLCDQYGRLLYTWSMPAGAGSPNAFYVGISGEEPTTSGYNYYWWNTVVNTSGTFTLNAPCF